MQLSMNILAKSGAGIFIGLTLLLAQACSQQVKSEKTPVSTSITDENSHEGHSMRNFDMPVASKNPHEGHGVSNSKLDSANTSAKLTFSSQITPKAAIPLVIDVQGNGGETITNFDKFQEQLMHLIVVSDDLQFFNHLHPVYKGNGRFEVKASFPQSGSYTLFSDYKPAGKAEQVSVLKAQVPGKNSAISKIDFSSIKTLGNTKVYLSSSQPTLKAGEEVHLIFNLKDVANNQPLKDLQPYLGERGHLVILKQSPQLTKADYIHAHAMKDTPLGEVHFITNFPQTGNYKLWGQFNRNGKVVTADFWVNVR